MNSEVSGRTRTSSWGFPCECFACWGFPTQKLSHAKMHVGNVWNLFIVVRSQPKLEGVDKAKDVSMSNFMKINPEVHEWDRQMKLRDTVLQPMRMGLCLLWLNNRENIDVFKDLKSLLSEAFPRILSNCELIRRRHIKPMMHLSQQYPMKNHLQ